MGSAHRWLVAVALWLCSRPCHVAADTGFVEPPVGSRDRKAILDSIRPQVEAAYQQKVKFSVRALQSNGAIALVFVEPLSANGDVLGERTVQNARGEPVHLDGWVFAIVEKRAKRWSACALDLLQGTDGLEDWPARFPVIPDTVFLTVGMATNTEG